ncbi:MAG: potassium channel family protein [Nitrospirota bacterium]
MLATRSSRLLSSRVLFTPADVAPGRTLLLRLGMVLALLAAVILILWLDRAGLRDQLDGEISFSDIVYFSMITVTTVGYGDIVPVTPRARLIDALIVTPIRVVVWFLFLGTAYQLVIRQYMEAYRMAKLQAGLHEHVIVCGFGYTGLSTVKELLAKGVRPERILVIDPEEQRVRAAVEMGVVAFQGDATQESILRDAVLEKAKALIIAAGRDDTNALILLTARHLHPSLRIIVSAQEEENVKLFRQGGANTIISPATFGGYILAAAVDHRHLVHYLEDLLTAGGRINLVERAVRPEEIGKRAVDLKPDVLLRVYRGDEVLTLWDLQERETLRSGDILVVLQPARPAQEPG